MASGQWTRNETGAYLYYRDGVYCGEVIQLGLNEYVWNVAGMQGTEKHYSEAQDAVRKALREQQPQPMDADTYQRLAARTLIDEPDTTFTNEELSIMLAALELGAAVGKVLEYVKKGICHRHGFEWGTLLPLLNAVHNAWGSPSYNSRKREYHLTGNEQMMIWCALGLGGEAGEVMETIHHASTFLYPSLNAELVKELGDNDWYNAALCTLLGVQMSTVMQANIDKLMKRFPDGWASEASKARVDTL